MKLIFEGNKGRLTLLAGSNVASNLQCAYDLAGPISNRRDSHRNLDSPAIFGNAQIISKLLDSFCHCKGCDENHMFFMDQLGRDDDLDRLTNGLN